LNKNGFEVVDHALDARYNFEALQEDATLMTEYEHQIERFLERKLGAEKVVIFDEEVSHIKLYHHPLHTKFDHDTAKKEKSGIPELPRLALCT